MFGRNKKLAPEEQKTPLETLNSEKELTPEEKRERQKLLNDLDNAIGSYCEIRETDNTLLLLGHIERVDFERFSVTVRSSEREMPPVIYNTEFKLMIRPRGGIPMVLSGKICGSSSSIWKFDCLQRFFYKESRNFFRQPTDTQCYVACVNHLFQPTKETIKEQVFPAHICRVMDVSLQGLQVRTKQTTFQDGDWLLLTDLLLVPQQRRTYNFIARVRRTGPAGRGEFVLGCQFEMLSEAQQDTLCSDIFVLHRLDIQGSRLG